MKYSYCPFCGTAYGPTATAPPYRCQACSQTVYDNPKPTASPLIIRDGKVLLARRGIEPFKGTWDMVGGFIDGREHPNDAVKREALEETGLAIEVTDYLGTFMDVYGDDDIVTLNMGFLARPLTNDEPTPQDDVAELCWFGPDELPPDEEFAFQNTRDMLAAWRARLAKRVTTF